MADLERNKRNVVAFYDLMFNQRHPRAGASPADEAVVAIRRIARGAPDPDRSIPRDPLRSIVHGRDARAKGRNNTKPYSTSDRSIGYAKVLKNRDFAVFGRRVVFIRWRGDCNR
ncbi:MAG TPA: hypothetical protein VK456_07875 [Xanthobacteraceae bacterium]|nr:hypothetical protein [Xanthobacteraceae bacterium]